MRMEKELSGEVPVGRGQGDPMSPMLFNMSLSTCL